jgi:hypothetical protein
MIEALVFTYKAIKHLNLKFFKSGTTYYENFRIGKLFRITIEIL